MSEEVRYGYIGFWYRIKRYHFQGSDSDPFYRAVPEPGQHPAASKDKHCRAAVECWKADQQKARRRGEGK
jgi:hypothetical protein